MEYKIIMPQLTDTMESGKIVRWLKSEGEFVEEGEPVVEVETDKAVMEVPSFKSGILVKILAEEGEEVPVGTEIAVIESEPEKAKVEKREEKPIERKEEKKEVKRIEEKPEEIKVEVEEIEKVELPEGTASPAAKKAAAELGIDIKKYQEKGILPTPAYEKDVRELYYNNFFDKKALEIIKTYNLSLEEIVRSLRKEKITKKDVENYIVENNIPKTVPISDIQKRAIENLKKSLEIPVYHIYEEIKTGNLPEIEGITLTTWLIKILGDTMQSTGKI